MSKDFRVSQNQFQALALSLSNPMILDKLVISRNTTCKTEGLKTHFLGLISRVNKIAYESIPTVPGTYNCYCRLKDGLE